MAVQSMSIQAVKVTVTEKVLGRAQQTVCTWPPKLQTLQLLPWTPEEVLPVGISLSS